MIDKLFDLGDDDANLPVETAPTAPSTSRLRKMFLHYTNNCADHREDAFRDRRYYDGDQISAEWRKNLAANEMPMVPINLIQDNITAHIGLIASQQTEIRAFGRNSSSANAADTATKLMRYAIDECQLDKIFLAATEPFFIEGLSAILLECDNEHIYATQIDYRDFCYDPNSRRSDFSDAKWMGFSRWLDVETIAMDYPESYAKLNPSGDTADFFDMDGSALGFGKDTSDDEWINDQKMVRVIEMYYLEAGQWQNVVWCHKGVLDFGPSAYQDDRGRSLCPIIAEACHTMADPSAKNQRYGQVRNLVYPQDDYNARRHAALKYMMSKTIQMVDPNAQPIDPETLRAEASKRIIIMPDGYQIQDTSVSAEQVQFMQLAGAEIQRLSPAAAVTGANLPSDASGRSRQLAAAGGRLSLTPILSRVQDWRETIYRHVWYRIAQYWHAPLEIRITSNPQTPKYLQINTPIIKDVPQPFVDPQTGQPAVDPMTGQPQTQMVSTQVGTDNEVAKMFMDFTITTVEQHNNLDEEVWEALMKMVSSLQVAPGTPQFRMALEWAPLPNKAEVIERYDAQMEKQQQDNAQQTQMQQQMEQMQQQLQMLLSKSKADKDATTAENNAAKAERTRVETSIMRDGHNQNQAAIQLMANHVAMHGLPPVPPQAGGI